ncbi:MAG TPA: hypothetical protein VF690_04920 [Hymenobacter sp.]|jgi:hypothetical protein
MRKSNHSEPYLKVLTSKWVTFPLLLILGFAGGFISAGYGWAKSGYQFLPSEIIVKPPSPNVIACFPDMGFAGALNFQKELATQMRENHLRQYTNSIVKSSIRACVAKDDSAFSLHLLHVSPKQFQIVSTATGGFTPYGNYTLVTESGCYYLHPIPKKRSSDYDSLIQKRWKQQAKL